MFWCVSSLSAWYIFFHLSKWKQIMSSEWKRITILQKRPFLYYWSFCSSNRDLFSFSFRYIIYLFSFRDLLLAMISPCIKCTPFVYAYLYLVLDNLHFHTIETQNHKCFSYDTYVHRARILRIYDQSLALDFDDTLIRFRIIIQWISCALKPGNGKKDKWYNRKRPGNQSCRKCIDIVLWQSMAHVEYLLFYHIDPWYEQFISSGPGHIT